MADKLPVKGVFFGSDAVGLAEFVTGDTIALANGGTGATTQATAANAILPSQTSNSGKVLTTNGTNVSWAASSGGAGGFEMNFLMGGM